MNTQAGASLIEVLLAVAIVCCTVAGMSLLFPKTSQQVVQNRQRGVAVGLAASKMDDLTKSPYAYIDVTPSFYFGNPGVCDCHETTVFDNLKAALPSPVNTETTVSAGTTFTLQWCLNFATYNSGLNTWSPQCVNSTLGDRYKTVHVRVSWISQDHTYTVDQEAAVNRS